MSDLDITQPSTHVQRQDRRMGDDWLEIWLEDWGAWEAAGCPELDVPCKTSLKVAEELRPEQLKNKPPTRGEAYTYTENGKIKALPLKLRQIIYEMKNMWKKPNARSTRSVKSRVPQYMPNRRMARINQAIWELHEIDPWLWSIVVMRYKLGYDWQRANREIGLPRNTFFRRLKDAKKIIRKLLKKWE